LYIYVMNKTDKGLRAYKERKWTEAFRLFMESDAEEGLSPEYLEKLAIAAYLSGKLNESIASWTRAYQEYADNDFNERAARCAFWLGMELMNTGERSRGGGWIARAGHIIEEYGRTCVEQGFLMLPAALQYLGKNDPENAYRKFRKAGEIGQTFKNPELMILAGLGKGQSLILKNKITEGSALLDEAMVAVESDEVSPIVVGIVYCAVIETCRKIYDLERAGEWISVLSRWCESQPEAAPFRDQCLVRRAELLQLRGDWAEAMNETLRACDIFGKIPGAPVAGAAYYCKGESYRLRGDFNQAEDAYRQASRLGKVPQPGLSLLHLAKGDVDGAQKSIIPVKDKYKDTLELLDILPAYAEIMLAAGNKPYAENAAKELSEIAEELKTPFILAVALRTTGSVLLTNDHAQQALNNFHEASVIFA
jgi:tetratricopeptide (TPR) repeat protein